MEEGEEEAVAILEMEEEEEEVPTLREAMKRVSIICCHFKRKEG